MTPLELLALVAVFVVARVALNLRLGATKGASSLASVASARAEVATEVPQAKDEGPSILIVIREYLDAFIVAGLVALLLITFVVRTFYIPSASMVPTLQIHDVLLVNEFEYRFHKPNRRDVVVFPPPVSTPNDFIKRVIGLPGDKLRIHAGVVYINDQPLDEPYINEKPNYELEVSNYGITVDGVRVDPDLANIPPKEAWSAPDRIPDGCYFMMGDNRNDSEDSHIWGFAQTGGTFASGSEKGKRASFTGHAFVVFWPLNRVHLLF